MAKQSTPGSLGSAERCPVVGQALALKSRAGGRDSMECAEISCKVARLVSARGSSNECFDRVHSETKRVPTSNSAFGGNGPAFSSECSS